MSNVGHATAGGARRRAISDRMSANICRGTRKAAQICPFIRGMQAQISRGRMRVCPLLSFDQPVSVNPRVLRSTITQPSLTRAKGPRRFLGRRPQMHGQIPPHLIETVNAVVRTSRRMLNKIGRKPTPEEVAAKLSMPLEKVRKLFEIAGLPIRLDA